MKFAQPKYLDEFCPNGHPILSLTQKCEFNCGKKVLRKKGKELHGLSRSLNRWNNA